MHSVHLTTADALPYPEGSHVVHTPTAQRPGSPTPQALPKATPGRQVHNCLKKKKLPDRESAITTLASSYGWAVQERASAHCRRTRATERTPDTRSRRLSQGHDLASCMCHQPVRPPSPRFCLGHSDMKDLSYLHKTLRFKFSKDRF